jgi:hypothetical protein
MNQPIIENHREVVGEVHNDTWQENLLRVSLDDWGSSERKMSESSLIDLVSARGYELVNYGNSGYSTKIVDEYEFYRCENCRSRAMYDSKSGVFYCPRCES